MQDGLQRWLAGENLPNGSQSSSQVPMSRSGLGLGVLRDLQDVCGAKVLARGEPDGRVHLRTAM